MRLPTNPEATSCFRFDGSSSYVSNAFKPTANSAFSISFWVNIGSNGNNSRIVDWSDSGPVNGFSIMVSGDRRSAINVITYNASGSTGSFASKDLGRDVWTHITVVFNGSTIALYKNGVSDNTPQASSGFTSAAANYVIGKRAAGASSYFRGLLYDYRHYSRALTAQEAQDLADGKDIDSTDLALQWIGNQNGGATVPDASGNGNTGTFTTPFYVRDSPFYPVRSNVGGNLVYNGDFEIYPKNDNVATTTSARWIEGTAGSTSAIDRHACGWAVLSSGTNKASAIFDTSVRRSGNASMKLSTLTTAAYIELREWIYTWPIPKVRASTSYTYSFWMKTNYVSGDAINGAYVSFVEMNLAGTASITTSTTPVKTTQDWTYYTGTITTQSNTAYIRIRPQIYGHQGTGTLIMDAWFDDITLTETTPVTRNTATGRLAVRDMGTSLRFTGSTSDRVALPITLPTDAFTISFWDKPRSPMGDSLYLIHGVGSFSLAKQGVNDMQVYAYLNAPNDFATPRRLRFRNFTFPGTINVNNVRRGFRPEWEHRAYVVYVEGGSGKCDEYVNGVKIGATHTVDYTSDTTTPNGILNVGSPTSTSASANIFIDEPRAWNRALSATEVADLYQNGLTPALASGLVGEWLFDEGSGSTAIDSVGGNNGTITGATYSTDVPCGPRSNA